MLREDQRPATPDEQYVLSQYRGWGGLSAVFNDNDDRFARPREELRSYLTEEEYNSARRTVLTSYFTPPEIVDAMWSALETAGFDGGRVLEPGCGIGGFFTSAPDNAHVVGVEQDATSALIANALHPQHQIRNERFQDTQAPDGAFNLAIGNVPFANVTPVDPAYNRDDLSLHNYFFAKSIALTAPGGYVAMITSQHTADSASQGGKVQRVLTDQADFITGVRLPGGRHGAFATHANTEVGTDILLFRVREPGREPSATTELFRGHHELTVEGHTKKINAFFADNPDNILGDYRKVSTAYGPDLDVRLDAATTTLGEQIRDVLDRDLATAAANGYGYGPQERPVEAIAELDVSGLITDAQNSMHTVLGTIRYTDTANTITFEQLKPTENGPAWMPVKPKRKELAQEWTDLIDIRNTTQALLTACKDEDTAQIAALQEALSSQYDAYTETYGFINRFEYKKPRAKAADQVEKQYKKLEQEWRQDNAVGDRAYEGELPEGVPEELREQAARVEQDLTPWREHLSGALANDPYMNAVYALENFNEETQTAKKSPLFTTNPLRQEIEVVSVDNLTDAVTVAKNSGRPLTVETFAELMGTEDLDRVAKELVADKIAFRDPDEPETWIPGQRYLSGMVRTKLKHAEEAAAQDARLVPNVQALTEALPPRIEHGITMSLGATWIPENHYRDFIGDLLNIPESHREDISVIYAADKWSVEVPKYWPGKMDADMAWGLLAANAQGPFNFTHAKMEKFSHHGVAHRGYSSLVYPASQALNDTMNMKAPVLNMSAEAKEALGFDPERQRLHPAATRAAGQKSEAIQSRFATWVTEDPERYDQLVTAYNERFNNVVAPEYDGAQRTMPGLGENFNPYPYQLDAVERMVNEPSVLLNHVVGAGKTGSMIMGAMELKRLGIANQPWLVVPSHLVDQIGREAKQWYPGANILVGSESESAPKKKDARQMVLAQSAQNDWDLVVVSDNAFKAASMSPEAYTEYMNDQLNRHRQDLEKLKSSEADHKNAVREIETAIARLETKMEKTLTKINKNDGITFDQTGCDYLIVDEAHAYKNLARPSSMADLACAGSDRATDMDMKIGWLRERRGREDYPTVTFATGTPIANNLAELWVLQHYLRPDILKEAGVEGINAWGANFTSQESDIDFTAGGVMRERKRISAYANVAELAQMSTPFMDTVDRDQIPAKLPTVRTGENIIVEFDVSQEVKDLIADLPWREANLPEDPRIDNPLKLVNDGKAATIDPRLAGLDNTPGIGRVHALAETVLREWEENKDNTYLTLTGEESPNKGALQIIFCDMGVPNKQGRFSLYDAIRDDLVAGGMDTDRIRYIHDWEDRRLQLFDDCNNGKVDVLIANTPRLATGANIQARAIALHHVDVPWRPADLQQQEGRIIRQGNQNPEVSIYNYVAKGTYDAYSWGVVARKDKFINQFLKADRSIRQMEPLENDGSDALAHNKAIATGNPNFIRQVEVEREVAKLETAAAEYHAVATSNVVTLRKAQRDLPIDKSTLSRIQKLEPAAQAWNDQAKEDRRWTIDNRTFSDRGEAVNALFNRLREVVEDRDMRSAPIAKIGGIEFSARWSVMDGGVLITSSVGALANPVPAYLADPSMIHGGVDVDEIVPKQRGVLTSMENATKAVPLRIADLEQRISEHTEVIARLEGKTAAQDFPQQKELDEKRQEAAQIRDELAKFDNSAAEKQRRAEYAERMQLKGRAPGYTLELNPTRYMRDSGIPHHPKSRPIRKLSSFAGGEWIEQTPVIFKQDLETQLNAAQGQGGVQVTPPPTPRQSPDKGHALD